jgi:hypothetical protein
MLYILYTCYMFCIHVIYFVYMLYILYTCYIFCIHIIYFVYMLYILYTRYMFCINVIYFVYMLCFVYILYILYTCYMFCINVIYFVYMLYNLYTCYIFWKHLIYFVSNCSRHKQKSYLSFGVCCNDFRSDVTTTALKSSTDRTKFCRFLGVFFLCSMSASCSLSLAVACLPLSCAWAQFVLCSASRTAAGSGCKWTWVRHYSCLGCSTGWRAKHGVPRTN